MSCGCENTRMGKELDRMRRLAKAMARMEDKEVILYRKPDGSFGMTTETDIEFEIVEYVSQY